MQSKEMSLPYVMPHDRKISVAAMANNRLYCYYTLFIVCPVGLVGWGKSQLSPLLWICAVGLG